MDQLNPTEDLGVAELNIKMLTNDMNYFKKEREVREREREIERGRERKRVRRGAKISEQPQKNITPDLRPDRATLIQVISVACVGLRSLSPSYSQKQLQEIKRE